MKIRLEDGAGNTVREAEIPRADYPELIRYEYRTYLFNGCHGNDDEVAVYQQVDGFELS